MASNSIPEVSVILPVFNAERFVEKAVQSVLDQTFVNFELIIVDDASTDASYTICEKMAKLDSRIILIRNTYNLGMMLNWNKALTFVRGQYWAKLDADDWWEKEFLQDCYQIISTDTSVGMVCGRYANVDEEDNMISKTEYVLPPEWRNTKTDFIWRVKSGPYKMFVPPLAQQGNGLIRTEIVRKHGNYLLIQPADTEFYFRIGAHYSIYFIDKLYHYHRVWFGSDTNSTIKNNRGKFEKNIYDVRRAIFDYYYECGLIDHKMYRTFSRQNRYEFNKSFFSIYIEAGYMLKALGCLLNNVMFSPTKTLKFYFQRLLNRFK